MEPSNRIGHESLSRLFAFGS